MLYLVFDLDVNLVCKFDASEEAVGERIRRMREITADACSTPIETIRIVSAEKADYIIPQYMGTDKPKWRMHVLSEEEIQHL